MASIRRNPRHRRPGNSLVGEPRCRRAAPPTWCRVFVVDTQLEPGARLVTFGYGMVVREIFVDLDDEERRLGWSARGGRLTHHFASVQVYNAENGGKRIVWTADLLPERFREAIDGMIEQGPHP